MIAPVNVAAGKLVAQDLGASDPNAWLAFAVQAQWENAGHPLGNNPFNLTDPGRKLAWGAFGQTGWYAVSAEDDFAAFTTLAGGEHAAAFNYLHQGSYGPVLAACTGGQGPIEIAQAIQASPWAASHYGDGLAALVSTELAALFAAQAAAKQKEDPSVDPQITTFTPPRRGTVPAGTRRFSVTAPYPELLPELPADGYLFDAWVAITGDATPHGHFLRTTTTPPEMVASSAVTLDPPIPTVLPDPAPAPAPAPTPAPAPAATVPTTIGTLPTVVVEGKSYVQPPYPPPDQADILTTWWIYNPNLNLLPSQVAALDLAWRQFVGQPSPTLEQIHAALGPALFAVAVSDGRFGPPGTPGTEELDFSQYSGLDIETGGGLGIGSSVIYRNGVIVATYVGDVRTYDAYGFPSGFLAAGKAINPPLGWTY